MQNELEYKEGRDAFFDGMNFSDNPYKNDADKYDAWQWGWFDAQAEEDEED